jgi:hypothetical protein
MFEPVSLSLMFAAAAVSALVGMLAARLFWAVDDVVQADRKKLSKLGKLLGQYGHVVASDVLQDAATGDLVDAMAEVENTLEKLLDPSTGPIMLQADLISQLSAQLAMPSAAPNILKAVAGFAANPANAALVKAAGLAAVAIAA